MNKNNSIRNVSYNNPFTLTNNNYPPNYEINYNDTRNQTNIIDIISRQVTNNVLNILNNNNYNYNNFNQSNLNFSIHNNDNIRDVFNKKINRKNNSSNSSKNSIVIEENKLKKDRYINSLNNRKENLNKFLFNYRYKTSKYNEKKEKYIPLNNTNKEQKE